ncbi:uncharacterized protein ARMOST_06527 [Armillaria ostoyae]|uniref:F-box domain-containing protein n=1 Tax=Armillaria ostoyae TaxID=47428 RepID=A0A284R391_ARMOS|nr:uncharacterized protein ARMOST_06527 [Armillaria ostoyae]
MLKRTRSLSCPLPLSYSKRLRLDSTHGYVVTMFPRFSLQKLPRLPIEIWTEVLNFAILHHGCCGGRRDFCFYCAKNFSLISRLFHNIAQRLVFSMVTIHCGENNMFGSSPSVLAAHNAQEALDFFGRPQNASLIRFVKSLSVLGLYPPSHDTYDKAKNVVLQLISSFKYVETIEFDTVTIDFLPLFMAEYPHVKNIHLVNCWFSFPALNIFVSYFKVLDTLIFESPSRPLSANSAFNMLVQNAGQEHGHSLVVGRCDTSYTKIRCLVFRGMSSHIALDWMGSSEAFFDAQTVSAIEIEHCIDLSGLPAILSGGVPNLQRLKVVNWDEADVISLEQLLCLESLTLSTHLVDAHHVSHTIDSLPSPSNISSLCIVLEAFADEHDTLAPASFVQLSSALVGKAPHLQRFELIFQWLGFVPIDMFISLARASLYIFQDLPISIIARAYPKTMRQSLTIDVLEPDEQELVRAPVNGYTVRTWQCLVHNHDQRNNMHVQGIVLH